MTEDNRDRTEAAAMPPPETAAAPANASSSPTQAEADAGAGILGPDHWAAQHAQDDENDANSALGSTIESSTASITSTILQYRKIHGRSYHSDQGNAQYW